MIQDISLKDGTITVISTDEIETSRKAKVRLVLTLVYGKCLTTSNARDVKTIGQVKEIMYAACKAKKPLKMVMMM